MKRTLCLFLIASAYIAAASLFVATAPLAVQPALAEHDDDEGSNEDEECPAGYEESEEKCTPEERENGCRDVRLDNGKGCVDRD